MISNVIDISNILARCVARDRGKNNDGGVYVFLRRDKLVDELRTVVPLTRDR